MMSAVQQDARPEPVRERVLAVDVLRGFDMFWITGGASIGVGLGAIGGHLHGKREGVLVAISKQFEHVPWDGFRFYDLIFPLFAFMVGMSVVFSLRQYAGGGATAKVYWRILRRFALLYVLGIIYSGGLAREWPDVRLTGVLQRLAICYLFASVIYLNLKPRDIVFVIVALLVGYWAWLTFVPVPGLGRATFEKDLCWPCWFDQHFLPGLRLEKGIWDPEGLLSSIPAIATPLLGVLASLWIGRPGDNLKKALALIGAGIAMAAVGYLWGMQFPIIKKIWTSSYVLVAGGYSAILLGIFILIIDVLKIQFWTPPFVWIGTNALAIYLANNFFSLGNLADRFVGGSIEASTAHYHGLIYADVRIVLTLCVAQFLYERKIFIRV